MSVFKELLTYYAELERKEDEGTPVDWHRGARQMALWASRTLAAEQAAATRASPEPSGQMPAPPTGGA